MNIRNITAFALAFGLSLSAHAGVTVTDAWAKASAPGQTTAAAYMHIKSETAAKLVGVSTTASKSAQIHAMKMQGNVMTMRSVDSLDLPAGKTVKLSGNYHIMLIDIAQPLMKGTTFPLTLTIEGADKQRQSVEVTVEVRDAMGGMQKQDNMNGMGGMKDMNNGY